MCTIELTALKFKAGESAKTDHKMRRPAHVQTELSEDIATQTSRMTKLPPNVLTGDPPLRYDDGIWDNPQGAFAWDQGAGDDTGQPQQRMTHNGPSGTPP